MKSSSEVLVFFHICTFLNSRIYFQFTHTQTETHTHTHTHIYIYIYIYTTWSVYGVDRKWHSSSVVNCLHYSTLEIHKLYHRYWTLFMNIENYIIHTHTHTHIYIYIYIYIYVYMGVVFKNFKPHPDLTQFSYLIHQYI